MTTLEQARANVQKCVDETMAFCLSDESKSLSFRDFEQNLWGLMLCIGKAFVLVFLVRRCATPRPAEYKADGRMWTLSKATLTDSLGTLFGVVPWTRPVGRLSGQLRGLKCDRIVDRELGLCNSFSLGVVERMCWLVAQMPYSDARRMFAKSHGWSVCSRSQERFIDALGGLARAFFDEQGAPEGDGEIMVVQVDAGAAPHISSAEMEARKVPRAERDKTQNERHLRRAKRKDKPRKRRSSGQKSKNGKMAFIAVIYTLRRTDNGLEGPINKRIIGTFESHSALFEWLRCEVDKRGKDKPLYFLADGCEHIWRLQQKYFPEAQCCLDWFHLVEKFWDVGRSLFPRNRKGCKAWVHEMKAKLRKGRLEAVFTQLTQLLDATPKTGPGNKTKRERLEGLLRYLTQHRTRLAYAAFRRIDMDIGTGLIEAAVRTVVRQRLDCSGMKWGRPRSECILMLRCIVLDGMWDDFVTWLQTKTVKLPSRPVLALTHDASPKAA